MGATLKYLYPIAAAMFAVLSVAGTNPGEYALTDLLVTLLIVAAAAAGVQVLITLALPRRRPAGVNAALTALVAGWFFYYIDFQLLMQHITWSGSRHGVLIPAGIVVTAALVAWLVIKRPRLERFSTFMATTGVVLIVAGVVTIVKNAIEGRDVAPDHPLLVELNRPVPIAAAPAQGVNDPPRDIYLIILDGYASAETLSTMFGIDNRAFVDSLRAMGFVVPEKVRSNYAQTVLSLSTMLNFHHLRSVAAPNDDKGLGLERYLIENNRSVRFLQERGYEFVFFPSAWFHPTLDNDHADIHYRASARLDLGRALEGTELRRALRRRTLLRFTRRSLAPDQRHMLRSFAALKDVPQRPRPTFTFAHMLAPHPPYVFDGACRALSDVHGLSEDDEWDDRRGYTGAVRCVNRQVLDVVRALLQRSRPEPIILLMGDHGTASLGQTHLRSLSQVSATALRERLTVFGAFYLPAGGAIQLQDPTTLINVMPAVFRHYFGARIPRQSDEVYFSTYERPLQLMPASRLLN